MQIRTADPEDAAAACETVRRSIIELCSADHADDPAILAAWLANKTPADVRGWIANPDNIILVATEADVILGVGAVTRGGEIILNYVSPDARFRGISKALLGELEAKAAALGNGVCTLTSTLTARAFYVSGGYRTDDTTAVQSRTGTGIRMTKALR
jgi:GNAT superfamily N-acetyltransferase